MSNSIYSSQFKEAEVRFRAALNYTEPYTFEQWASLPEDMRPIALYVQFYPEIDLAKYNCQRKWVIIQEDDALSTVLQYLQKNSPIIYNNPKRFTQNYIYRVAFNCISCLGYILKDQRKYENEVSESVEVDGEELSLFDTVSDVSTSPEYRYTHKVETERFWAMIGDDPKVRKVVDHLINGTSLKKASPKFRSSHPEYPLNEVEVSLNEMEEIISKLRIVLAEYKDYILF